jgi:muramoyltetrapeptide carboxypeptidase
MNKISRRSFIPLLGTAVAGASAVSFSISKDTSVSEITLPPSLKKGDTIGVCAPAGGIKSPSEITDFKKVLNDLGYSVVFSENIEKNTGYFSGTDQQRGEDFMNLIKNEDVKAIFFIRGGWGCARMLEYLDFEVIKRHPKIIMGFSDPTALLNAITVKTGLITFHGPGGNSTWNNYSLHYINELLVEGKQVNYHNQKGDLPIVTYSEGTAQGEFFGGNLSVLSTMIGSEYLPDWKGKVLFLEDVAEEPYRIDRMLTHLKLAGVFDQISGLILGTFRKCLAEEPNFSFTLEEVFEQHFKGAKFPVYYGAQIGHTANKFTIPIGLKVEMNAGEGTFRLMNSAVQL